MVIVIVMTSCCLFSCTEENVGRHYWLKDAYEEGLLTNDDLAQIAELYSNRFENPDSLAVNMYRIPLWTQSQIKKAYFNQYILKYGDYKYNEERVEIYTYYGTYNGAVVVGVADSYCAYDLASYDEYKVGDVIFYKYLQRDISIWVNE